MKTFRQLTLLFSIIILLQSCSKIDLTPKEEPPVFDSKANYMHASFITPGIAIHPDGRVARALGLSGSYFNEIDNIVDATGGVYVLKNDGTVWTLIDSVGLPNASQVGDLDNIIDIEYNSGAAAGFMMALKNDGTVWTWGNNRYGQLGDSSTTDRNTPRQINGLKGIKDIAAGFSAHALALKNDGTVWGWGYNTSGELGSNSLGNNITYPVKIEGFSDIVSVSAGNAVTVALKKDGTVWTCGNNVMNQLGNGGGSNLSSPVQVNNLSNVTQISAGYLYALALKRDSTVWAWGCNTFGNLGDGTTELKNTTVQVKYLSGIKYISQGCYAIDNDDIAWEWGASMGRTAGYNGYTGDAIMKSPDRIKQ